MNKPFYKLNHTLHLQAKGTIYGVSRRQYRIKSQLLALVGMRGSKSSNNTTL